MRILIGTCEECGQKFEAKTVAARFCGRTCQKRARQANQQWLGRVVTRENVLLDDYTTIAETLRKAPGVWHLVGQGSLDRYRVFVQTAYRIRNNKLAAFEDGSWEVRVVRDPTINGEAEVEVFARSLP